MTNSNPRIRAELRVEAVEWLVRFSEGEVDAAARKGFNDWLRTSPEHVRTYLRIAAFWQDANRIEPAQRRDIEALVANAQTESNVLLLGIPHVSEDPANSPLGPEPSGGAELHSSKPTISRRAWPVTIAAALVLTFTGLATWQVVLRTPTYKTDLGELRTLTLDDGSIVTLNADSRMSVNFTATQRFIELDEGQAFFRVRKDPDRPFIVRSGDARVTAVGTQFDVNRKSIGTVVTVLEGRVSVVAPILMPALEDVRMEQQMEPMLVAAGEQAIVTPQRTNKRLAPNATGAAAWTTGLLVFDTEPLREVAAAFNRQNSKQLVIEDSELQELKISGVFPSTAVARMAEFLRERFGVQVIESETEFRIEKPQG